jgi:hypothetical protein
MMTMEMEVAVNERLVRVETKLDVLLSDLGPRHTDHETRIRALTSDLAVLKTKVAVVAGGFGTVAGVVTSIIAHLIGA